MRPVRRSRLLPGPLRLTNAHHCEASPALNFRFFAVLLETEGESQRSKGPEKKLHTEESFSVSVLVMTLGVFSHIQYQTSVVSLLFLLCPMQLEPVHADSKFVIIAQKRLMLSRFHAFRTSISIYVARTRNCS